MAADHPPEFALELQYPPAKRHKGLSSMTDIQAWEYSDEEIIAAARETWRSPVYDHYNIHLERRLTPAGTPDSLVFRFECKHSPRDHSAQYRERLKTGAGTHNLLASAKRCDERRNGGKAQSGAQPATSAPGPGPRSQQPTQPASRSPAYSEAKHRALLAMRACIEHVPPASIVDGLYQMFADFLRPGTKVPSGETVAKDIESIYSGTSKVIYDHLQQIPGELHLAIDGWTNPTSSDTIVGIVVFWFENGKLWRALLDVVWVGVLDVGDYLADRVLECLKEYGIDGKIMSVCLNNAPQNEKIVAQLAELIPSFRGAKSRVRDLPHTVGLMSKAFMSFFYPPSLEINIKAPDTSTVDPDETDPDDSVTELELTKPEYDDYVIQTTTAEAQTKMAATHITIPDPVLSSARRIMPKISGLARYMDETASSQLRHTLRELVKQDPDLASGLDEQRDDLDPDSPSAPILTRRVAGQWNTDRDALESHLAHKDVIRKLVAGDADDSRELGKYALTEEQWRLVEELSSVLEVFQELTSRFSQPCVPLVNESYPELLSLRARLQDIRDDFFKVGLSSVTRVAAQASLLVFDKYMGLDQDSDVYDIAVVMRPDYKLKWFSARGYDVERIRARLTARFNDTYASEISDAASSSSVKALTPSLSSKSGSVWTRRHSSSAGTSPKTDTIEHYLLEPVLSPSEIIEQGGPIAYWTSQLQVQPRVARMALDYLTTPASSVDSERVFSGARIQTYGLDEGDTFRAQMCIPTWYKTPLLPDVQDTFEIIERHMRDGSH